MQATFELAVCVVFGRNRQAPGSDPSPLPGALTSALKRCAEREKEQTPFGTAKKSKNFPRNVFRVEYFPKFPAT